MFWCLDRGRSKYARQHVANVGVGVPFYDARQGRLPSDLLIDTAQIELAGHLPWTDSQSDGVAIGITDGLMPRPDVRA